MQGYTQSVVEKITKEVTKVIINQDELIEMCLIAMLSGGHVLIEGVPGLGKTLMAKSLAKSIHVGFNRVQFTSDLMPSDIVGTKIFNLQNNEFELKKGPLFTNFFLADEINRTPPKTQSALLQVMEERVITIDGEHHDLQEPFMVFATQNPVEYEGTYPLPEALVDRFMMKLYINYPGNVGEKAILNLYDSGFEAKSSDIKEVTPVVTSEEFLACLEEIKNIKVDDSVKDYIIQIVEMTRKINVVSIGASPRGTISLYKTSKTFAAFKGRDFVTPDDVQAVCYNILRHRIILKPEAEIDGVQTDSVIEKILGQVKVPR